MTTNGLTMTGYGTPAETICYSVRASLGEQRKILWFAFPEDAERAARKIEAAGLTVTRRAWDGPKFTQPQTFTGA
jgi:hypothetical protein